MTKRQTANTAVVILVGLLLAAGDPQRDAARLVQRGLDHFRDDQFADAEAAFAQALEIVPDNDIVLFDQGCAALSAGKQDEARSLLRSASLSRQPTLAAKAHYNLGSLESTAARELLGAEPEAAEGDTRTESIALLQAAVQQYRSTLQRQPDHAAARHNLELVRLYIKHLQSQWAERDRQKNRDEKNLLQFLEIMFFTDLVQYWFHRCFHEIPWLWKFHAVHHSAKHMDWLAGSRMHLVEIVLLRAFTTLPMYVMGFAEPALYAYIFFVYLLSTFVHSNVRFHFGFLQHVIATPRFHHWHHGIEKEAINVNYAVHFPVLDRLFGTHHLPGDKWPEGYGIASHPVPTGYWQQFLYPFRKSVPKSAEPADSSTSDDVASSDDTASMGDG